LLPGPRWDLHATLALQEVERLEPLLLQPLEALLQDLPVGAVPAPLSPARQQAKAVAARREQLQRLKSLVRLLEDSIRFSFQVRGRAGAPRALLCRHQHTDGWMGWARPFGAGAAVCPPEDLLQAAWVLCCLAA
jgi:hypothetical protein